MKQAWFCPSCQKHHGPHVDTCPGVKTAGEETVKFPYFFAPHQIPWPTTPPNPPYWYQEPWQGPGYTIT